MNWSNPNHYWSPATTTPSPHDRMKLVNTLKTKIHLAATLRSLGDHQSAKQLNQDVFAVLVRTLGAEHPDTLATKGNLAVTLDALGDLQGAKKLQQEAEQSRGQRPSLGRPLCKDLQKWIPISPRSTVSLSTIETRRCWMPCAFHPIDHSPHRNHGNLQ